MCSTVALGLRSLAPSWGLAVCCSPAQLLDHGFGSSRGKCGQSVGLNFDSSTCKWDDPHLIGLGGTAHVKLRLGCSVSSGIHCHMTIKELSTVFLRIWPQISCICISWRDGILDPTLGHWHSPTGGPRAPAFSASVSLASGTHQSLAVLPCKVGGSIQPSVDNGRGVTLFG